MTAITSYLRHLIVTAVLLLIEEFKLPVEGSEDAAHAIALLVIGTLTWALVKYAPDIAKKLGLTALILIPALLLLLPSCETLTGSISYIDAGSGAKGGLVFRGKEKPTGFVRIPILDDNGNQVGVAELGTITPTK